MSKSETASMAKLETAMTKWMSSKDFREELFSVVYTYVVAYVISRRGEGLPDVESPEFQELFVAYSKAHAGKLSDSLGIAGAAFLENMEKAGLGMWIPIDPETD